MVFSRVAAFSAVVFSVAAMAAGCGSGLSKEDADIRCDQERQALGAFLDDAAYKSCETCFMDCGDGCRRLSTSPISYTCDEPGGSGGSGGAKAAGGAATK